MLCSFTADTYIVAKKNYLLHIIRLIYHVGIVTLLPHFYNVYQQQEKNKQMNVNNPLF
jgi:hypothetical protein